MAFIISDSSIQLIVFALVPAVAGLFALWRFVLQQPFDVAWESEPASDIRVKPIKGGKYEYIFRIFMHNLSASEQICTNTWVKLIFPEEAMFEGDFYSIATATEATCRLGDARRLRFRVPSGGHIGIEAHATRDRLCHVVQVGFAIEAETRTAFGLRNKTILKPSSLHAAVDTNDIRLIQQSGWRDNGIANLVAACGLGALALAAWRGKMTSRAAVAPAAPQT